MKKAKFPISKELKEKLIKVAKDFDLDLLVLFGSRARGDFTKDSDWDFAYLSLHKINNIKLLTELEKILIDVDLVEINSSTSIFLKKEIADNSILIYEKRLGLYEDFLGEVFLEYIDNKEYLDNYINYLKEKLGMKDG